MESLIDNEEYQISEDSMRMWNSQLPQRVKVFLLWDFRGVLPMRMRLQDRGVACIDCYPHCKNSYENDWHLFIGCKAAKQVWQVVGLWELVRDVVVVVVVFNFT